MMHTQFCCDITQIDKTNTWEVRTRRGHGEVITANLKTEPHYATVPNATLSELQANIWQTVLRGECVAQWSSHANTSVWLRWRAKDVFGYKTEHTISYPHCNSYTPQNLPDFLRLQLLRRSSFPCILDSCAKLVLLVMETSFVRICHLYVLK